MVPLHYLTLSTHDETDKEKAWLVYFTANIPTIIQNQVIIDTYK